MKKIVTLAIIALLAAVTASAQQTPVMGSNAFGAFKLKQDYKKVKTVLKPCFTNFLEEYQDMGEYMSVSCYDGEDIAAVFYTDSFPDDNLIIGYYVRSPKFKTAKGYSLSSTAAELLEAGGELDKVDMGIHIKLDGLYFWFEDQAMTGRRLDPEAKPFMVGTAPYLVF